MSAGRWLPASIADIDGSWLTGVLRDAGAADGSVVGLRAEPLAVEFAFLSELTRLVLSWEEGTGPASVVVKLPAGVATRRAVATGLGMYRREVGFYRHLAPRVAVGHAGCYFAGLDDETQHFVLVLSDIAPTRQVDQVDGCCRADAEAAVDALADLHAGFWSDDGLACLDWLGTLADPGFRQAIGGAFQASWPLAQELFATRLTPGIRAFGNRYCEVLPAIAARLSEPPSTLCHGDFRLDNLFFDAVADSLASAVAACDWQLGCCCRGARDVAYFLGQSVTPELRTEVERPLLARYVARLEANGVAGYDLDTASTDYRLAACLSFAYPVIAGAQLLTGSQRGRLLGDAMFERSARQVADVDPADLLGYRAY